jgi:hypothetical protein
LSQCPCDPERMNRKCKFLRAVQILAPGDDFVFRAAARVPEETLLSFPGGAALEMVVALQKVMPSASRDVFNQDPERAPLSLSHALRIQSAHFWLELGEVDQALLELGALSTKACRHPLAVKARMAVLQARRKLQEVTVRE